MPGMLALNPHWYSSVLRNKGLIDKAVFAVMANVRDPRGRMNYRQCF